MPALDALRGLVMIVMALDHAGAFFDTGHLVTDSAAMYTPETELPPAHFLTHWINAQQRRWCMIPTTPLIAGS